MTDEDLLGKQFHDFENECLENILQINVNGFNLWQIVKFPLYLKLIQHPTTINEEKIRNKFYFFLKAFRQIRKIFDFMYLTIFLGGLLIKRIAQKKYFLLYSNSSDRSVKNDQGKFENFLIDPFINEGLITNYVYVETLSNRKPKPSLVKVDFDMDKLYTLRFFLNLILKEDKKIYLAAERLEILMKEYFKGNSGGIKFSKLDFIKLFNFFYLDFQSAKLFLKIVNPFFIIASEQVGKGLISAANFLRIRSIDLQHGIIDQYHPQYSFTAGMKQAKRYLSIPTYIGVFGTLHRDLLLKNGFWDDDEIVVLGSSRMNNIRLRHPQLSSQLRNENIILIPTQYTVFKETLTLINLLTLESRLPFKIILKFHPLEPSPNIIQYKQIARNLNGLIEIAESDFDIYKLIKQCKLVIGFDSASLLEAVCLSKPVITIGTHFAPQGIHEFFSGNDGNELRKSIKLISISDNITLDNIIYKSLSDLKFYNNWIKDLDYLSEKLYAHNYIDNCRQFIDNVIKRDA